MAQLKARFERISQGQKNTSFTVFPKDTATFLEIPLEQIIPDPLQPRKELGDLTGLQASIAAHGLLQPLVVSPTKTDLYQLIAGERRYTASKALGLVTVPALVRTSTEHQRLELQLVENLHRKDLSPLEEATSYQRLMAEFGLTQEDVAHRVGKSLTAINQTLRLLDLPAPIRSELQTSEAVSKSVLLEVVKAPDQAAQTVMWEQAKQGQLTVQQARQYKVNHLTTRAAPAVRQFKTRQATVTVCFRKSSVTAQEIQTALQEAVTMASTQQE